MKLKKQRAECPIETYTSLTYNLLDYFEWDENKRLSNVIKHEIDFVDACYIFSDPNRENFDVHKNNEKRHITIGQVDGMSMKTVNIKSLTNWERLQNMTEEEIKAAANSDPDCPLLTDKELKQFKRVYPVEKIDVRSVRDHLRMTQEQFAHYFGVNPRTIQEWEQKRRRPSSMARNFLRLIAYNPGVVREALAG